MITTKAIFVVGNGDSHLKTSIFLFGSFIPLNIILAIAFWPNWNLDELETTGGHHIGHNNIKTKCLGIDICNLNSSRWRSEWAHLEMINYSQSKDLFIERGISIDMRVILTSIKVMIAELNHYFISTSCFFRCRIPPQVILALFLWPDWNLEWGDIIRNVLDFNFVCRASKFCHIGCHRWHFHVYTCCCYSNQLAIFF